MATYVELFELANNNVLRTRIAAAVAVQADVVRLEAPAVFNHVNRLLWAKRAFADPEAVAKEMTWALLAQNRTAAVTQITEAADTAVLAAVAAAVDIFATG